MVGKSTQSLRRGREIQVQVNVNSLELGTPQRGERTVLHIPDISTEIWLFLKYKDDTSVTNILTGKFFGSKVGCVLWEDLLLFVWSVILGTLQEGRKFTPTPFLQDQVCCCQ